MTQSTSPDSSLPRILIAEPENYSAKALEILQKVASVDLSETSQDALPQVLQGYDVVITRLGLSFNRAVLDAAPNLRAMASATTGLDHFDVDAANDHNIEIISLKGEVDFLKSIRATSEHTWGLLLNLIRNATPAANHVREGGWDRDQFKGYELNNRTMGLVGCGRIGEHIAGYAQAFQMDVIAFDPYKDTLPDGVKRVDSLHDLCAQADVIGIHVPLNDETHHLIDKAAIDAMKPTAFLVNTSRGDCLDENALIAALKENRLAGAAVDVVSNERPDEGETSPMIAAAQTLPNLLITPHIAGATYDSMANTEIFIAEKIVRFLES